MIKTDDGNDDSVGPLDVSSVFAVIRRIETHHGRRLSRSSTRLLRLTPHRDSSDSSVLSPHRDSSYSSVLSPNRDSSDLSPLEDGSKPTTIDYSLGAHRICSVGSHLLRVKNGSLSSGHECCNRMWLGNKYGSYMSSQLKSSLEKE
ncbi:hypothetical protein YC2023_122901 [Brassica napus]